MRQLVAIIAAGAALAAPATAQAWSFIPEHAPSVRYSQGPTPSTQSLLECIVAFPDAGCWRYGWPLIR